MNPINSQFSQFQLSDFENNNDILAPLTPLTPQSYSEREKQEDNIYHLTDVMSRSNQGVQTPINSPISLQNQIQPVPANLQNQIQLIPANLQNQIQPVPANLQNQIQPVPANLQNQIQAVPANLQNQNQPVHPNVFFYRTPNDFFHYYVKCKEVPYDTIVRLLGRNIPSKDNEFIFFYRQQHDDKIYQVSCEIVPHTLINHSLNKHCLGIGLQNMEDQQEHLVFTSDQKENLEYQLKQRLSQYSLN